MQRAEAALAGELRRKGSALQREMGRASAASAAAAEAAAQAVARVAHAAETCNSMLRQIV